MCTGIYIVTQTGQVIFGRTLEFGKSIEYERYSSPDVFGTLGDGLLVDGLNTRGLAGGTFYFPHYGEFAKEPVPNHVNLNTWEFLQHVLENYGSVAEVVNALPLITVVSSVYPRWGSQVPLHWMLCDTLGECVVIESVAGELKWYDNKNVGVLTNAPMYPEHVKSLDRYKNLSAKDRPGSISEGTGAVGLPGDFSSVSRFVRAHYLVQNTLPAMDAENGVITAFHILNSFDIPKGTVYDPDTEYYETTQYTIVYDLQGQTAYKKTYNDLNIKCDGPNCIDMFSGICGQETSPLVYIGSLLILLLLLFGVYMYFSSSDSMEYDNSAGSVPATGSTAIPTYEMP